MAVNHIICAAGEGRRFRESTGATPKPLIMLKGRSMLVWSLDSLQLMADDRLIIITQADHRVREKLGTTLADRYPFTPIEWLELDGPTRGQLETAYLSRDLCDPDKGLAIFNCDNYFQSHTLAPAMADPANAGVIPCFQAGGDAWSFCAVDDNDRISAVREKQRISPWASIGFYHFRDAGRFFDLAQEALGSSEDAQGEYYIAPLYQRYIDAGERIVMDRIGLAKPMGTPEQIETFWNISMDRVVADNRRRVLVVDIDHTITIDRPGTPYDRKTPHTQLIKRLQDYKEAGFEIILHTARRMGTCKGDESKVLAMTGEITLQWLKAHGVPFDGIRFGKPWAQNGFYIDDKSIRPSEFLSMDLEEINALLDEESSLQSSGK